MPKENYGIMKDVLLTENTLKVNFSKEILIGFFSNMNSTYRLNKMTK